MSLSDCLTDLCVDLADFEADEQRLTDKLGLGKRFAAHKGMLAGAKTIADGAKSMIAAQLAVNDDYTLVITGHSLGAGTAAILGSIWRDTFPDLKVYAYGPPCIAPKNVMPTSNQDIISVINVGDPFATLSLGHIADVASALKYLAERRDVRNELLEVMKIGDGSRTRRQSKFLRNKAKEVRSVMTNEKFYPPGQLYEMDGRSGDKVVLRKFDEDRWSEMPLKQNILDIPKHVPIVYEELLTKYKNENQDEHKDDL